MRPRLGIATVLALALAGCGGGDRPDGTPATSEDPGGGNATYCAPEALTRPESTAVRRFNRARRADGLAARFNPVQASQRIPDVCDVALIDVDWMGHQAAAGALADLTDRVERRKDDFIGETLATARYGDRYWGLPRFIDVGLLYYEKTAGTPPFTWQQAYALARKQHGLVYPAAGRWGAANHFLELAYAAGGRVLSEDGGASEVDSPQNLRALQLMRRGITSGAVPRQVLRMGDEGARRAFDRGVSLMRNWTYAYGASRMGSWRSTAGVLELPAVGDGEPAAVLSGLNVVVAADAATEEAALALADHLTGDREARRLVDRLKLPTALAASYEDSAVRPGLDYELELERTVAVARANPVTPKWPQIMDALGGHVRAALSGRVPPREALAAADHEVAALLSG